MNDNFSIERNEKKMIDKGRIIFQYLVSKWWLFFIVACIFGVLGITYAWLKDPEFTAEMTFTTDLEKGGALGMYSGLAAQFGVDLSGGTNSAFEGDNLIELLKSRNIIEKTLLTKSQKSNLLLLEEYIINHQSEEDADTTIKQIRTEKNLSQPNRFRDSILGKIFKKFLKNKLSIERKDKKLSYIQLKFIDNNEEFAKKFVEILANNAIDYYVEYKGRKAKKNFELLNNQCDSVKNLLYGNIQQIAVNNDLNVNPLKQVTKAINQKVQVNASANTALYTELLKQLGLARVNLQRETPLIQIIDYPKFPLQKEKPGRLLMGIIFAITGALLAVLFVGINKWKKIPLFID